LIISSIYYILAFIEIKKYLRRQKMKNILYVLALSLVCALSSCENNDEVKENIDVKVALTKTKSISAYSIGYLSGKADFTGVNSLLASFIRTEDMYRNFTGTPQIKIYSYGIFKEPSLIKYPIINSDTLVLTNPLYYPSYFENSAAWKDTSYKYETPIKWNVLKYSGVASRLDYSLDEAIAPISLTLGDTIMPGDQSILKWNPSKNSNSKVYISFRTFPNYSAAANAKEYPGFETEDDGSYILTDKELAPLQLPDYGILQIVICRGKNKTETVNGEKIMLISGVEATYSIYIGKK
jgi:hypothetical protein